MTLTERKTNPAITAMFVETLTQPEMEEVSGGYTFLDVLEGGLEKAEHTAKCLLGCHEMVDDGKEYGVDAYWGHKCCRYVKKCKWNDHKEYTMWYIGG